MHHRHTVEVICVGDELLDGSIADKNAYFTGTLLSSHGLAISRVQIVPDTIDAIVGALAACTSRWVVVSGGLGPTTDDITREAAAAWQGCGLERDSETLELMRTRFANHGYNFTANNARQADFPAAARILQSEVGSAAGFRIDTDASSVFFFPGVPREFVWFVQTYVAPVISEGPRELARMHFHGVGESQLETRLAGLTELAAKHHVRVGYRAEYPLIEVKLVAPTRDDLEVVRAFVMHHAKLFYIGDADAPLPVRVGDLLKERGESVATAESCTAGMIAAALTDPAGSSKYFGHGYVTYANEAKVEMIGVRTSVLENFGAVSAQTVCQMAAGARDRAGSTWAIAVSGIAGPGGGTEEKPVGTVHFGLAGPQGVYHRRVHFRVRTRDRIRSGTVYTALALLAWAIEDELPLHSDVSGPYSVEEVMSPLGIEIKDTI